MHNSLIPSWISARQKYLDQNDAIEADRLEFLIRRELNDKFDTLPVEAVLESLTHLGDAPNLLYDDNGLWAIVTDGTQPCVSGKQKLEGSMTFWCEKRQWFSTIRKAIKYYLKEKAPAAKNKTSPA